VLFHEKRRIVPKLNKAWTLNKKTIECGVFKDKSSKDKVRVKKHQIIRVIHHFSSKNIGTTQLKSAEK
jgi:hypothetical protein